MSRTLSRWQAVLLGLVVLIALVLGAVGLFAVGSRGWYGSRALHVRVGFPEIRGVEVGTRVRIQGIDSGEVVTITPPVEPDGPVELRLRIRGDHRHLVRNGSVVQIVSEGMLGAKVVEVRPPRAITGNRPDMRLADEDTLLEAEASTELTDVLGQVGKTLASIERGEGTVGKLMSDPQAYEALVGLLRKSSDAVDRSKDTMTAIQRDAEALKRVPFVGKYVEDPVALLVRSGSERNRRVFAETDLFQPGRAVLTISGREKLDALSGWVGGLKHKGSDVVVVSYASADGADGRLARELTKQQSEAVASYLRSNHKVHKLGWFSSRKVTSLGMGTQPSPTPDKEPLPAARTEVLVFVPQS